MLVIQPEDRPTTAGALSHRWLTGLKGDNIDSGDYQDEVTQGLDESARSTRSRDELATHDRTNKRQSERNPINQDDTRCIPGDLVGANPRPLGGREATTLKAIIDTSITTPSDATSVESSVVQPCPQKSEFTLNDFQTLRSGGTEAHGSEQACDIPPTCPQSRISNAKLTLHTSILLTRIGRLNIDALQSCFQFLTHTKDIVSNQAQRQATQRNTPTLHRQRTTLPWNPRPTPLAEIAETKVAQPSIYYKFLTPGEAIMLAGVLTGILMLGILKGALILAGILMLARIPTLIRAFIRVLMPDGTLTPEETWGGTERQPRTDLPLSDAETLTRISMPAGTQVSMDSSSSGRTERQPRTELKLLVAERRREGSDIKEGSGAYIGNGRNRSPIESTGSRSDIKIQAGSPHKQS